MLVSATSGSKLPPSELATLATLFQFRHLVVSKATCLLPPSATERQQQSALLPDQIQSDLNRSGSSRQIHPIRSSAVGQQRDETATASSPPVHHDTGPPERTVPDVKRALSPARLRPSANSGAAESLDAGRGHGGSSDIGTGLGGSLDRRVLDDSREAGEHGDGLVDSEGGQGGRGSASSHFHVQPKAGAEATRGPKFVEPKATESAATWDLETAVAPQISPLVVEPCQTATVSSLGDSQQPGPSLSSVPLSSGPSVPLSSLKSLIANPFQGAGGALGSDSFLSEGAVEFHGGKSVGGGNTAAASRGGSGTEAVAGRKLRMELLHEDDVSDE